ncbi:VOC family protein [Planktotalea sp.]|uniref:VOC family protein n=1 Tax=Planktotalea sp. TaxID=2029877 RepID=UPI003D6C2D33
MPHFEIYVADVEAGKAYYGGLFGWTFDAMPGGEAVSYHLASGAGIGGDTGCTIGMLTRPDTAHPAGSAVRGGTMTFDVDNCDDRYAWALANGGAEALPPTDFPGVGRCAYVEDGQGNIVGMITSLGAS